MEDTARDRQMSCQQHLSGLMGWLMTSALPTWWAFGIDHAGGGFREKLGLRCETRDDDRRVRVIARQIYSFAVAGRLGWTGRWKSAVEDGLDYFLARCVKPDGTVRKVIGADGRPVDDSFELYDQAFALFALAAAATVVEDRARVEAAAVRLRDRLVEGWKHPEAGFEEANPRKLPLKANPHMHLLEACLAWSETGGDGKWMELADEIAELCLSKFLAPEGWLREFFDGDWAPMPGLDGRLVEPGHQFEWAWLLMRWGNARSRPDALAAAKRLAELGERFGIDRKSGVAINELLDDGSVHDAGARLWPQTERIKAQLILAEFSGDVAERAEHAAAAAAGCAGLALYLETPTRGLWRDRLLPDGTFKEEPAPASSFYHIVCAIEELSRRAPGL